MSAHVLQCVWPVLDSTRSRDELIAEAERQLDQFADKACAVITGPPLWYLAPAANIQGWQAYAPGQVLVGAMPAEPYGAVSEHMRATVDHAAVERVLSGDPPARLQSADKREVERVLTGRGLTAEAIAEMLGVNRRAVAQTRHRGRVRASA